MTHSGSPHRHLFDIAHQAQKKAVRARRRKMRRAMKQTMLDACSHPDMRQVRPGGSLRQRRGSRGEERAVHYLRTQGLRVLARNIHCRTGEIDLVATDGITLIFVEVRLRGSTRYGGAAASVDTAKQHRLIRTAQYHLPRLQARFFAGRRLPCRFDVISIDGEHLHWIRHAFGVPTG